jgi:hypothetical protein
MMIYKYLLFPLVILASALPASAQISTCAPDGTQTSGAKYRICMPSPGNYNGDLVVYAHGYVSPLLPPGIPESQLRLPNGVSIPTIINSLGFGFATSGYSVNGWAVKEGIADLKDLVDIYTQQVGAPSRVYLIGVSEGGLIAAKSIEMFPSTYSGSLAACGIVGDFPFQINYVKDWQILFNYYFPGVLPGSPVSIPNDVIANYASIYRPAIAAAIVTHPLKARQMMIAGNIVGLTAPNVLANSLDFASGNVEGTNAAAAKFGGQPYSNTTRTYNGTTNDTALNAGVQRFSADPAAVAEMQAFYQTSGAITRPVVTLHNTLDPTVPYQHEVLYQQKVALANASALHLNIPVAEYGHCNFTTAQWLAGFSLLVGKVSNQNLTSRALPLLSSPAQQSDFLQFFLPNRSWAFRR